MLAEDFGPFLVEERKKKGFTQETLATKLHVSKAAVSKWERGLCLPEVSKFEDIAKALELSLMEVMQCKRMDPVMEMPTEETLDGLLLDTIKLSEKEKRAAKRKRIGWTLGLSCLVLILYFFPVYHIAMVWSPSYFTSGEMGKLAFRGYPSDVHTARLFMAQAEEAFSDLTSSSEELSDRYGLFKRYAYGNRDGDDHEKHSLRLWAADFDSFDGYGYVWVYYSSELYDAAGENIAGSWHIPSLWIFEKDESGKWILARIKEHP